jgi:CRISPR-associated exonuclease Cas4
MVGLLIALFILLLAAGLLLRRASQAQRQAGLPRGRVIYADTGAWRRTERPLFSRRHRLAGKPDYLLDDGGEIIPVEVKSGTAPPQPYPSHVLQLAAYGLLVEEVFGTRPSYGIVRYRDRAFAVDLTPGLADRLFSTLDEMRQQAKAGNAARSHDNPAQCAACGYRPFCDQSLV